LSAANTNAQSISVAVTAPTGLAAYNVGGVTIHRLFMLPVEHGLTAKYEKLSSTTLLIVRNTLVDLKLLLIDEISIVYSLLLTYIHLRLCEITGREMLFGGIDILLLGDLLQLQPVKGNAPIISLNTEEIKTKMESIGAIHLWDTSEYDELTINVRHSSDDTYAGLLSRVRMGEPTTEDIFLLRTRLISSLSPTQSVTDLYHQLVAGEERPVCLLSKVDSCKKMNEEMLLQLKSPIITIHSKDEIDGTSSEKVKHSANVNSDVSRTAGLEGELKLAIGARVMLRRKFNMEDGLVNRSIGTLLEFVYVRDTAKELYIKFDNGICKKIARSIIPFELLKGIYVFRNKFPISLPCALTIHKSPGISLSCALIDIGPLTFGPGMSYVALSRVTSLTGLYLLDLCSVKIVADVKIVLEYNRLQSKFKPELLPIQITIRNKQPYT